MFQGLWLYTLQGHFQFEGVRETTTILNTRLELNYFEIKIIPVGSDRNSICLKNTIKNVQFPKKDVTKKIKLIFSTE